MEKIAAYFIILGCVILMVVMLILIVLWGIKINKPHLWKQLTGKYPDLPYL